MTVRYIGEFATNSVVGCFIKLLFRWRGSVYKLVWTEYVMFITAYYAVSFIYRFALNDSQQIFFDKVSHYCDTSNKSIGMAFVLGFFVTSIVSKWWKMYDMIPWPDPIAQFVHMGFRDEEPRDKLVKKTIVRHCVLSLMLTLTAISPSLKRRYPTLDHLISEGLLTEDEKVRLEKIDKKSTHSNHWLPLTWIDDLVVEAEKQEKINGMICLKITDFVDKFRTNCVLLLQYEQWSVPLAYIQVVTISVYAYFFSCLFGRQWIIRNDKFKELDLYFPFFTTLEFIFYMGWLKVAESLINPFGCDDDDFELDDLVHRHLEVTQAMVSATDGERYSVDSSSSSRVDNVGTEKARAYYVNEAYAESSDKLTLHRTPSSPPPDFTTAMGIYIGQQDNCAGAAALEVSEEKYELEQQPS